MPSACAAFRHSPDRCDSQPGCKYTSPSSKRQYCYQVHKKKKLTARKGSPKSKISPKATKKVTARKGSPKAMARPVPFDLGLPTVAVKRPLSPSKRVRFHNKKPMVTAMASYGFNPNLPVVYAYNKSLSPKKNSSSPKKKSSSRKKKSSSLKKKSPKKKSSSPKKKSSSPKKKSSSPKKKSPKKASSAKKRVMKIEELED